MFFKVLTKSLLIAGISVLTACTGFNKVKKSTDVDFKFTKAEEFYNKGKYNLALPVLEDLVPLVRGTSRSEKVFFYFSMCFYHMGDFQTAGGYLKTFSKTFPKSTLSEEAFFLSALCSYNQSPKFNLDQSDTYTAINDFQLFLNYYPESKFQDTCNLLMTKMRDKLERKSFETCKLYYQTERYKSAVVAFNNMLRDYPNSQFEEELLFMALKSNYQLAENSVDAKKEERYEDTIKSYERYIDKYKDNGKARQAESIYKDAIKAIENLKKQPI